MIITLTILLFLCGIAGFILNRNNVILLIVAIELLLLAVPLSISYFTGTWPSGLPFFNFLDPTLLCACYNITTYCPINQQPNINLIFFILVFLGLNLILLALFYIFWQGKAWGSLRYMADKLSLLLKLLLLIFIVAFIWLNFSDEIYSNIQNNYNYYLFLIYKCCLDWLSLLGLYLINAIDSILTLWKSGNPFSQINLLSGLIHGNVESGDNLYVNEDEPISTLTSADFISNYLDDNTSHSIFLAENNEVKDSSALTDVNNDLNSSFIDEHGYLPGLGTHRTSLPTEDVNSANEATREDQRSVQERNVENLTPNSQSENTTVSTRPEEEGQNIQQTITAENSAVQPLTSDSNAGFVATAISPSPNDALSSDTRPFNPFSLKN